MGQSSNTKQSDPCNIILGEIYLQLQKLENELTRLRSEKAKVEDHLSTLQQKFSEQAKELEASRKFPLGENQTSWVVTSVKRKKFHRLTCEYAVHILQSDNAVVYETRDAAIKASYKPCSTCCP
jgi:predicted nuclease with TOPRIM domain